MCWFYFGCFPTFLSNVQNISLLTYVFVILLQYLSSLFTGGTHVDKFFAGSAAGVTAVTLTYPLDTIRARLAFQVTGEHVYSGIVHTAVCMFREVFIKICISVLVLYISLTRIK